MPFFPLNVILVLVAFTSLTVFFVCLFALFVLEFICGHSLKIIYLVICEQWLTTAALGACASLCLEVVTALFQRGLEVGRSAHASVWGRASMAVVEDILMTRDVLDASFVIQMLFTRDISVFTYITNYYAHDVTKLHSWDIMLNAK